MKINSTALNYGVGLFETMKIKDGTIEQLEAHLKRLFGSVETFGLCTTYSKEALKKDIEAYCDEHQLKNSALKVILQEPDQVLISHRAITYKKEYYEKGYHLTLSEIKRHSTNPLWQHKTTNYWLNMLVRQGLDQEEESLFLNENNEVMEGTVSNIFAIVNGCIVTPPASSGLLLGIMREQVINQCKMLQIPFCEQVIYPEMLLSAEGIFITNSLMGVMPVSKYIGMPVKKHLWIKKLMEALNDETRGV